MKLLRWLIRLPFLVVMAPIVVVVSIFLGTFLVVCWAFGGDIYWDSEFDYIEQYVKCWKIT